MLKSVYRRVVLKKSIFGLFLAKIEEFPLWIKQIIFLKLSDDIKSQVCEKFLKENSEDIFSLYKPTLTFKGSEELKKRCSGLDLNIYNFLEYCENNASILEISLNTFLSMEEVAKYFIFCIEQNYIEKPENIEIEAMAGFIAGKFRTGEYFRQKGVITDEQLEKAVDISEKSHKKFAEILVDLGFITRDDVSAMLAFKEESKKRFVLDYNTVPQGKNEFCNKEEQYKKEIEDLKRENEILKKRISQLLEIVKNNGTDLS